MSYGPKAVLVRRHGSRSGSSHSSPSPLFDLKGFKYRQNLPYHCETTKTTELTLQGSPTSDTMASNGTTAPTASHVPPRGVWVPAVTFYKMESEELDLEAQAQYFKHLSQSGLAGVVVMGTNSEAFLLTREERASLVSTARASVGPNFPIMAGVGAHSTKQALELAEDAAMAGANYLLVLPPAYFGKATTMTTVKRFFSEFASKAPLPVVIYNFPGVCNGVDIDSETITSIVRESASASQSGVSNVVGVKLTCGSVGKITRLAAVHPPEEFSTYGGQSDFLIGGLAAGSAGCIAAFGNAFPKLTAEIYRRYTAGDVHGAMDLQKVAALAESPCKSGIASTKFATACFAARMAGIKDAERKLRPRHPYEELPEQGRNNVQSVMGAAAEVERKL